MMNAAYFLLFTSACIACAQEPQRPITECSGVPDSFVWHVQEVLADTTGRFVVDYPKPPSLTCELLQGLQEAMTDDSVRYHFEHLAQRYADPRASAAFNYIPKVRILFQSLRKHHPEFVLHLALADKIHPEIDLSEEPFDEIMPLAELGIPSATGCWPPLY